MKNCYLILSFALMLFCGCKTKPTTDPQPDFGTGCITRLYPTLKSNLSARATASVDSLIQINSLTIPNYLVPYSYVISYINTYQGLKRDEVIRFDQYANKQLLFYNNLLYTFLDRKFNVTTGRSYGGNVNLDTIARTGLQELRTAFLTKAKGDSFYANINLKDSCLVAQFGYYDLNAGSGALTPGNFVKAWRVAPSKHSYPELFIRDDGTLISYFNGIYTFAPY